MIQLVITTDASILTKLFDNLLRHGIFPRSWEHARWVPIPRPGHKDISVPKNLRPISLLLCLGKKFQQIVTQKIAETGAATGAISEEHMGSRANLSAIDTLMTTLTTAQEWLLQKSKRNKPSRGPGSDRPSLMANDIDGAFNYVLHSRLPEIMEHYQLPNKLTRTVTSFTTDRTISMSFDDQME